MADNVKFKIVRDVSYAYVDTYLYLNNNWLTGGGSLQ